MPKRKEVALPVGLIGYGYWGPNLLRVLNETPGYDVRWVCDADPLRLAEAKGKFPGLHTEQHAERALRDSEVKAVDTEALEEFKQGLSLLRNDYPGKALVHLTKRRVPITAAFLAYAGRTQTGNELIGVFERLIARVPLKVVHLSQTTVR